MDFEDIDKLLKSPASLRALPITVKKKQKNSQDELDQVFKEVEDEFIRNHVFLPEPVLDVLAECEPHANFTSEKLEAAYESNATYGISDEALVELTAFVEKEKEKTCILPKIIWKEIGDLFESNEYHDLALEAWELAEIEVSQEKRALATSRTILEGAIVKAVLDSMNTLWILMTIKKAGFNFKDIDEDRVKSNLNLLKEGLLEYWSEKQKKIKNPQEQLEQSLLISRKLEAAYESSAPYGISDEALRQLAAFDKTQKDNTLILPPILWKEIGNLFESNKYYDLAVEAWALAGKVISQEKRELSLTSRTNLEEAIEKALFDRMNILWMLIMIKKAGYNFKDVDKDLVQLNLNSFKEGLLEYWSEKQKEIKNQQEQLTQFRKKPPLVISVTDRHRAGLKGVCLDKYRQLFLISPRETQIIVSENSLIKKHEGLDKVALQELVHFYNQNKGKPTGELPQATWLYLSNRLSEYHSTYLPARAKELGGIKDQLVPLKLECFDVLQKKFFAALNTKDVNVAILIFISLNGFDFSEKENAFVKNILLYLSTCIIKEGIYYHKLIQPLEADELLNNFRYVALSGGLNPVEVLIDLFLIQVKHYNPTYKNPGEKNRDKKELYDLIQNQLTLQAQERNHFVKEQRVQDEKVHLQLQFGGKKILRQRAKDQYAVKLCELSQSLSTIQRRAWEQFEKENRHYVHDRTEMQLLVLEPRVLYNSFSHLIAKMVGQGSIFSEKPSFLKITEKEKNELIQSAMVFMAQENFKKCHPGLFWEKEKQQKTITPAAAVATRQKQKRGDSLRKAGVKTSPSVLSPRSREQTTSKPSTSTSSSVVSRNDTNRAQDSVQSCRSPLRLTSALSARSAVERSPATKTPQTSSTARKLEFRRPQSTPKITQGSKKTASPRTKKVQNRNTINCLSPKKTGTPSSPGRVLGSHEKKQGAQARFSGFRTPLKQNSPPSAGIAGKSSRAIPKSRNASPRVVSKTPATPKSRNATLRVGSDTPIAILGGGKKKTRSNKPPL